MAFNHGQTINISSPNLKFKTRKMKLHWKCMLRSQDRDKTWQKTINMLDQVRIKYWKKKIGKHYWVWNVLSFGLSQSSKLKVRVLFLHFACFVYVLSATTERHRLQKSVSCNWTCRPKWLTLQDFTQRKVISFVIEFEATLTTMTDFNPLGMVGFHRQVITGVVDAGVRS